MKLQWHTPKLKHPYRAQWHKAKNQDREYYLRPLNNGWRLIVFDGSYIGARNHTTLQAAKRTAEQWEKQPGLWL